MRSGYPLHVCRQGFEHADPSRSLARAFPMCLVRSATVAACTVALGLAGHVIAGGMVADPTVILLLFGTLTAVALHLSGRQFELRGLIAILMLGQGLVHLSCLLGETPAVRGDPALMLLTHGVATIATAFVLRRGDELLWRTGDLLLLRVVALSVVVDRCPTYRRPKTAPWCDEIILAAQRCGTVRVDRGPPVVPA